MTMNERKTIDLDQGWEFMQKGITKLKNILEGHPEPQFSSEDYMMLYTYPLVSYFNLILWPMIFVTAIGFSLIVYAEPSTICALKSPLTITRSSCMISTGSLSKNTLRLR